MSGKQNFFKQLWPREVTSKRKLRPVGRSNADRVRIQGDVAPTLAGGGEPINIGFTGALLSPREIGCFKVKIDVAGQWKLIAGTPAAVHQVEAANEQFGQTQCSMM